MEACIMDMVNLLLLMLVTFAKSMLSMGATKVIRNAATANIINHIATMNPIRPASLISELLPTGSGIE